MIESLLKNFAPREAVALSKRGVLRNFTKFTGIHLCQSLFLLKKETLAQLFSCAFCKIFKNTLFYGTPLVAASAPHSTLKRV